MAYYEKIDKNQFSSKAKQVLRMEMLKCECLPQSGCPDNCLNVMCFSSVTKQLVPVEQTAQTMQFKMVA